jgi:NAD(P)H-dependent flavin oxidoreductase YrpB (nitropropane dioxygenase family)
VQGARVGREAGIRARELGDVDNGNAPCGQSAGLIREIVPAGEVVRRLVAEAEEVLARIGR